MCAPFELQPQSSEERVVRRRRRLDPKPHFKPDRSAQLDPIAGCPMLAVPPDHVAHLVRATIEQMDFSAADARYSSLGQKGFDPRHKLGVLVLGSMMGIHHSTKLAVALHTDAALRLVSGGHRISAGVLRCFRRENAELFADCIEQTIRMAHERGLLVGQALAVDSMRLRADAARSRVRTREHAERRIPELEAVDPATLSPDEQKVREQKLERHRDTLARCTQLKRTNIVATNPSASLIKFPNGSTAPGHRVTVTSAGVS
jgi:transposase